MTIYFKQKICNLLLFFLVCILVSSQFYKVDNNLGPNSEFFLFSWIYGVRWGIGENIFSPHSHLIYPVFSGINKILGLSDGGMKEIFLNWYNISYWWPISMSVINVIILYTSSSNKNKSLDIIVFACAYIFMFSYGIGPAELSSMSYHSFSISIGLASLYFYKNYLDDSNIIYFKNYYILLGLYSAICVLAKLTFIAFVIPIYIIEFSLVLKYKDIRRLKNIIISILFSLLIFFIYLYFYYGSLDKLDAHIEMTKEFIRSQKDYYAENKGDAFPNFLMQQMGWGWIVIILVCFVASIKRKIILIALFSGLFIGTTFLYGRPNSHAVPEFFALIFSLIIFSVRNFWSNLVINKKTEFVYTSIGLCFFIYAYPLPFKDAEFIKEMNKVDRQIIPEILKNELPVIIAVIYPDYFMGSIDAWCRGSKHIFINSHSDYFDKKFDNKTCLVNEEHPNFNPSLYTKVYTIRRADENLEIFLLRFKKTFPSFLKFKLICDDFDKLNFSPVNSFVVVCKFEK
jgi:hypothetical protein